jgi:transcription initiation factor TFIID subunit 7
VHKMSSDHKLELENQFILRLPPGKAEILRQAIRSGEPLSKRLFIKFDNDIRHGHIKLDDTVMPARLYDLPAIIESYKTLDRKNFYKTADISQILICKEDDSPDTRSIINQDNVDEETKKAKYDQIFASIGCAGKKEYLYPHGITPPLKNVRKRRFRKTLKKKYVDFSEIEKEVKRLFKFDCEAIDSRYEIVEESKVDKVQPTTFSTENPASPMSGGGPAGMQSAENSQNIDINELFGEGLSSSDDSDDDDDDDDADDDIEELQENDKDMDQEDNMDFDEQDEQPTQAPEPTPATVADIAAEVAAASDLIAQNDDNEERKQYLNGELSKIRERIQIQESEMMGLDNQALRNRLQKVLDNLHEQENEIKKQLEELSTQM